jgi:hypothetical protein
MVAAGGGILIKGALVYLVLEASIGAGSAFGALWDASFEGWDYSGVTWRGTLQVPYLPANWQP